MNATRMGKGMGLALSIALAAGCVAQPNVVKTQMPSVPGETYGQNFLPPEVVKALPIGSNVVIPPGRAALTLFVVIPRKAQTKAPSQARYINFSNITSVQVTITGENLTNPVQTTINVSSGMSAAGTVLLNAGRNQIITAVGRDSSGNVVSTVQGVATSVAGQVVNAVAEFGTTPLAEVVGGLSPSVAPLISTTAISGVIDPILNATTSVSGSVTYGTHPAFINPNPIISAIDTLVTNGNSPSAITSSMISTQMGATSPVYPASTVSIDVLDTLGNPFVLPTQGALTVYAEDLNGDGIVDGTAPNPYYSSSNFGIFGEAEVEGITLSDPVSGTIYMYGGASSSIISNVPPGTYLLSYNTSGISTKPWQTLPYLKTSTISVSPGTTPTVNLQLIDVSTPVSVGATGSFASDTTTRYGSMSYQWFSFPATANLIYQFNYSVTGSNMGGNQLMIFDQSGAQLYQSTTATGSYTFASAATTSLYVYTPYINTTVNVTTQSLSGSTSLYNTLVNFNQ